MSNKVKILTLVVAVAVIFSSLGYFFAPEKVKIEKVEVEKVVERVVVKEVAKRRVKRNIETTRRTEKDGTVVETTRDLSTETSEKETKEAKVAEKTKATKETKEITRKRKDWLFNVGVGTDRNLDRFFHGQLQRRLLGDIYVGGFGTSRGEFGVGITILF